jgi:hypothetical protein
MPAVRRSALVLALGFGLALGALLAYRRRALEQNAADFRARYG